MKIRKNLALMLHYKTYAVLLVGLCVCSPIFLPSACSAQIAPLSKLFSAAGFLEVCGPPVTQVSKDQFEATKNVPPSQFMDKLKEAMADRLTEKTMCYAFLSGLQQGWKEGHEHGVVAAQFPEGWPKDEQKALAALPPKQLQDVHAAMTVDVPCIPDYVTFEQMQDILVKYIRTKPVPPIAFTYRVAELAFQEAFPCVLRQAPSR